MVDATLWVAAGSILTALATLVFVIITELLRRHQAAFEDLQALQQVVLRQYRDDDIDRIYAIPIGKGNEPSLKIKEIRDALWRPVVISGEGDLHVRDKRWNEKVTAGLFQGKEELSPEASLAMELSHRLERLGWSSFYGQVPVEPLLSTLGDQIVDDWQAARALVSKYRQQQGGVEFSPEGADKFLRSHAEWISLVAALYMRQFGYKLAELVLNDSLWMDYPGGPRGRLKDLMNRSSGAAPLAVRWHVYWLTFHA